MKLRWSFGRLDVLYVELFERGDEDERPDNAALEVYNERAPEPVRAVPDERHVRAPSLGSDIRPMGFSRQP
jgi:hypothetical protein